MVHASAMSGGLQRLQHTSTLQVLVEAQRTARMASAATRRVVSLLPSATELVVAAAGEGVLVGRSHECDFPSGITDRPVLTAAKNPFVDSQQMHDAGAVQ